MTNRIQAIAFDKDGTLLDFHATWMPMNWAAARHAAREEADLVERLMTAGGYDAATDRIRPSSPLAQDTNDAIAAMWHPYTNGWSLTDLTTQLNEIWATVAPKPVIGLTDTLDTLRSSGLPLGVITSDAEAPARAQMLELGLLDRFDFVAGYDSGFAPKPNPEAIHAFCAGAGVEPAAAAFVGDNAHDMEAGRNAACGLVVGILTGTSSRDDLAPLADCVLDSIAELPGVLAS